MAQQHVKYVPEWTGEVELYARKYAIANHWKVRHALSELEDAFQECVVIYLECVERYGERVDNAKWFMDLFKQMLTTSFVNHARAGQRSNYVRVVLQCEMDPEVDPWPEPQEEALGPIVVALAMDTSPALRQVLLAMASAPQGLLDRFLPDPMPRRSATGKPRADAGEARLSRAWCELAGVIPPRNDLICELRELLHEEYVAKPGPSYWRTTTSDHYL